MRNKSNIGLLFVVLTLLAIFFISACSEITREQAEIVAGDFVRSNVKFFAIEGESALNLTTYDLSIIESYKEGTKWVVLIHISSSFEEEVKKNDIVVEVGPSGDVLSFNGRPVPQNFENKR